MPELPEVETTLRGLRPSLLGATLDEPTVFRPNLRYPFPEDFAKRLLGNRIVDLQRRAKYLFFYLEDGLIWVTHLGMTGRFQIDGVNATDYYHQKPEAVKHTHLSFWAKRDNQNAFIRYIDPRRFGFMSLYDAQSLQKATWYAALGLEPLSDALDVDYFLKAFVGAKAPIKSLLMRQDIIAGLGNIYVCEALFAAGLSPERAGQSIRRPEAVRLLDAIKRIIHEAIAAGGSSISDFAATDGALGYFQHRFKVYDREGAPCTKVGCRGQIERIVQQGRASFFCHRCQK